MITQLDIFTSQQGKQSNYSWETSYEAYNYNRQDKEKKADWIYRIICSLIKDGKEVCSAHVKEITKMESGIISARVNDLIEQERIKYDGVINYKGFQRKRIVLTTKTA